MYRLEWTVEGDRRGKRKAEKCQEGEKGEVVLYDYKVSSPLAVLF